jgi:hypothetical protein
MEGPMNDPHVVALYYVLDSGAYTKYINAPPIEHETTDFKVRLAEGEARLEMKSHFSDPREAQRSR